MLSWLWLTKKTIIIFSSLHHKYIKTSENIPSNSLNLKIFYQFIQGLWFWNLNKHWANCHWNTLFLNTKIKGSEITKIRRITFFIFGSFFWKHTLKRPERYLRVVVFNDTRSKDSRSNDARFMYILCKHASFKRDMQRPGFLREEDKLGLHFLKNAGFCCFNIFWWK